MSLYKRGDIWWVKLYQDGVPVYKTTRMTDKREAQRLHDIWAGELQQGTFLPRADQTRYEELVEDLKQQHREPGSRRGEQAPEAPRRLLRRHACREDRCPDGRTLHRAA
jgi:hypothetical protein